MKVLAYIYTFIFSTVIFFGIMCVLYLLTLLIFMFAFWGVPEIQIFTWFTFRFLIIISMILSVFFTFSREGTGFVNDVLRDVNKFKNKYF